jgi:predicted Zn-dependent protease
LALRANPLQYGSHLRSRSRTILQEAVSFEAMTEMRISTMTAKHDRRANRARTAALSLLLIAACTMNPATGQRQLTLMSEAQEIQMGRQTHPEVLATYGAYDDPEWQRYIQELGGKLAALSERPHLDWTFTVLDDPVVNAMALPGGFVYVNRGILAHFNSEAELASVLGHEIGHVTARHSVEQISRAQLAQLGLGVAAVASEEFRQYAGIASQGLGILFLKFGRDDENQSDALGLRYLTRAGYDPREMPKVFATLDRVSEAAGMRGTPEWMSTHPDPGNRIHNIDARISQLPADDQQGIVAGEAYLKRLEHLVFGDDPRQGYTVGQTYYHPELAFKIEFPDQWRIINQRQAVGALSPNRDAAVVLTLSDKDSPQAAFDAFFAQQGIQRGSSQGRNLFSFRAIDPETGAGRADGLIGFHSHDGRVYQLMGYTGLDTWQAYGSSMQRSLASFTKVTDRRYLEVEPKTIDIVELPHDMTFAEFVKRYPSTVEIDELAIINEATPETRLEKGRLVKRVIGGELPKR